ncbi:MAG: hypothetical protein GY774_26690 [Planctomycetes bacterium]|nr:hypothetical protein [Planctomycetota bacterium]
MKKRAPTTRKTRQMPSAAATKSTVAVDRRRHTLPPRPINNPAHLLLLIRDGTIETFRDLIAHCGLDKLPRIDAYRSIKQLTYDLELLEKAGFLQPVGFPIRLITRRPYTPLAVTEMLTSAQRALGFSLTELSLDQSALLRVTPVFGVPYFDKVVQDLDVFVLMPFSEELRPVYNDHIKGVLVDFKLSVARADDVFSSRAVMTDIWAAIFKSRLVIADCTDRNPNVFYEVGIAHTVGRPVIILTQTMDDVPFDLRHMRCLVYKFTPRGLKSLERRLAKVVQAELGLSPETV